MSFILLSEATRLGMKIEKASQLANQVDGETKMYVLGEVHDTLIRGNIKFIFNALVVKKLNNATILAGMNFLLENNVCQEPHKHRVQEKYSIEETPPQMIYSASIPVTKTVNIKKMHTLLPNDHMQIDLPKQFPSNAKLVVNSTDQANPNQTWLCQEIQAVNRTVMIENTTSQPIILGKNQDTSVLKLRPITSIPKNNSHIYTKYEKDNLNLEDFQKDECTLEYVDRINSAGANKRSKDNEYLPLTDKDEDCDIKQIFIEPGVMNEKQHGRLWSILRKYCKVPWN